MGKGGVASVPAMFLTGQWPVTECCVKPPSKKKRAKERTTKEFEDKTIKELLKFAVWPHVFLPFVLPVTTFSNQRNSFLTVPQRPNLSVRKRCPGKLLKSGCYNNVDSQ